MTHRLSCISVVLVISLCLALPLAVMFLVVRQLSADAPVYEGPTRPASVRSVFTARGSQAGD